MPQLNKTSPGDNPVGKVSSSKAIARDRKGRRTAFIIASVVIVLILIRDLGSELVWLRRLSMSQRY